MRFKVLILSLVVLMSSNLLADEVIFKNGEKLIGKLVRLEGGKLTFKSDMIGEQTFDVSAVKNFTSDSKIDIHLPNGAVIVDSIQSAGDGKINSDSKTINISEIKSINPVKVPPVKWSGNLNVGFTSAHGNTFSQSGSFGVDLKKDDTKNKTVTDLGALYVIARSEGGDGEKETTEENVTARGKKSFFVSDKKYHFVSGKFKKDHIADLDRRLIGTLGSGYQWVKNDKTSFSTDLGLAILHEKYVVKKTVDTDPGPGVTLARVTEITQNDELSANISYKLETKVNDKVKFIHETIYYPSFNRISDYYLSSSAELRANITDDMFTSLKALLDYDSTPADDSSTTDTKYIVSLGWGF